jgi:chromosome segregation ATPase
MNRAGKPLFLLFLAAVAVWGCSQAASQSASQADKIKTLEAKCSKLEDDYKAAAAARDQAKKRVAAVEEEHAQIEEQIAQLQKDLEAAKLVAKERDELKTQVRDRTGERDLLQARCDKMKKGLQDLLGQDDAMASPAGAPAQAAAAAGATGGTP